MSDEWSIHHVNLPAHDVRQSAAFFSAILGMTEGQVRLAPRGSVAAPPTADTLAVFGPGNRGLHINRPSVEFAVENKLIINPTIGGHVAITVPDLDAVKRRLDRAGILYADVGEFAMEGLRSIYVYDPSMNCIEVNQVFG